jgi:hypothetical protein
VNELLQSIRADLASRRLLPVLVVVCVGLVAAVAYAATGAGSPSGSPPATPAASTAAPSPAGSVPVSAAQENPHAAVAETPGGLRYQNKAPERNPFTPIVSAATTSASSTGASSGKGSASGSAPSHGSSSPGSSTGGQPAGKGSAPAPAKQPPAKTAPKPSHTGLKPTQSYTVALSLTSPGGNLDVIESLERLSVLPSEQEPLLVYLGVLEGGRHVLFAVPPGTSVSGPGACTPGPTDCELLSLAPDQIESLATSAGVSVALFTVTAIKTASFATVAAANRARTAFSAFGNARLNSISLPALALFEYQPVLGALVDLRNLSVGGEK